MTILQLCPNKKDTTMKSNCHEVFVGVDVSKGWLDIGVQDKSYRVCQTKKAIDLAIKQYLIPVKPNLCVVESTGGYERLVVERLHELGLKVHIAHPSRVRAFAQAKGYLAKTDKLDSYMLSAYGEFIGPDMVTTIIPKEQQQLRDLLSRQIQIKELIHAEECRLGTCVSLKVKGSIRQTIEFLKKQATNLEAMIQGFIQTDIELQSRQKLLLSMKGVGQKTSQMLLIHLPELGRISGKKIAALVGVAPITKQSGRKQGYAKIQQGRHHVRKVLFMAALVAARYNPLMKTFYEHLLSKGKPPKVALVAVMRKMLVTLNAMIRDNVAWQPVRND
jgi:transposase